MLCSCGKSLFLHETRAIPWSTTAPAMSRLLNSRRLFPIHIRDQGMDFMRYESMGNGMVEVLCIT